MRSEAEMTAKFSDVHNHWRGKQSRAIQYNQIDPATLRRFDGTHPQAVRDWLPPAEGLFQADANYRLTARDKKHRLMLKLEEWFGFKFNKKHYRSVA